MRTLYFILFLLLFTFGFNLLDEQKADSLFVATEVGYCNLQDYSAKDMIVMDGTAELEEESQKINKYLNPNTLKFTIESLYTAVEDKIFTNSTFHHSFIINWLSVKENLPPPFLV